MENSARFKSFKDAVEWAVAVKKEMPAYRAEHGTTKGFNPYDIKVSVTDFPC